MDRRKDITISLVRTYIEMEAARVARQITDGAQAMGRRAAAQRALGDSQRAREIVREKRRLSKAGVVVRVGKSRDRLLRRAPVGME